MPRRPMPRLPAASALALAALAATLSTTLSACMEPQPAPSLTLRPSTDFAVTTVASGLSSPWSVAPLPGGGALVTEKGGKLFIIGPNGGRMDVSGLPDVYYVDDGQSQAGLFDVVPADDFMDTGHLYLSAAYGTPEANGTALYSATLDGKALRDVTLLFKSDPKGTNAHYGAKIVLLPDGTIALSTGDAFVLREMAQYTDSTLGKVVRVNADGSIPADNPFGNAVWSYGHRNVQGLALDRVTGELWEHEHGPRGGDEINRIERGANYGWPIATTGTDYNGLRISPFETVEGLTPFVHDWVPSIAPSGLVIYRGDLFPEWQGDALVGALAGKSLRRVDLENGASVGEEILLGDLEVRIRDVREAPDGSVWVLTNDGDDSKILRVAPLGDA